ncbi:hypothetical protein G6F35_005909 [Rhizopus arrhizus]|nr:hypothetical protein G6F35_005909 [Rhizopus arrhizus]
MTTILKRSATTNSRLPGTLLRNHSIKELVKSTSNTWNKNLNDPQPAQPQQGNEEDEELKLALQRAWAVLDAEQSPQQTENQRIETQPTLEMNSVTGRIQTVKTLNTRIYIDDANNHRVVQLTNLLTSAMVIQSLKKKGVLDHSNDWTLFEIANSHCVERPLREWEIVLDIISAWEPDDNNALLVKKYSYHYTLTSETIFQKMVQPMHGWLTIEYKKGKWQKRYCFIKDNAIHSAKDKPLKISPTPFVFAIRAQDRASIFEKEGNYIRFIATEDQEEMKNWVLSIRCSKSHIQHQYYPNRVVNPLAPIVLEEKKPMDDNTAILRRQKSTKTLPTLTRSESNRKLDDKKKSRGLTRNSTTIKSSTKEEDGPLIDCSDPPPFVKGSLLAKEDEIELHNTKQQQVLASEEVNNTLIHIDDKVRFAKGSLLAKKDQAPSKMMRSKSVRELSASEPSENNHKRHVSLRRKPTSKKSHEPTNNSTLLQLDDTPEKFHSRELHGRHVKPLLNFDSDERTTRK